VGKADREMNISVANYLANEFDAEGKATPIVYGMTDPVFRSAAESGKILEIPKWPSLRQAVDIGRRLGARYVLVYDFAAIKRGTSNSQAALYMDGKRAWSEKLNLGVNGSHGVSADQSGESIARTWAMHICLGPLKSVVAHVKLPTKAVAAGQAPEPIEGAPAAKVDTDSQVKTQVDTLVQAGDFARAVAVLRDAVDQKPFDVDRRILLVQALLDCHRSSEAGEEADRAVLLAPDNDELRALAARAWIAAGRSDEARSALNGAIARNPGGEHTRLMLAELSLARQEPDKALDHLDAAIKERPTREAYYMRGLCRALLGQPNEVNANLTEANKLSDPISPADLTRLYALAGAALDEALKTMGEDTRLLMQRAQVHPDDTATHDKVSANLRALQARVAFLSGFPTPEVYRGSNDRRGLATRLLVQTMLAIQSFFSGGGQDAMIDARVDLGEALKEAAGARSAFEAEQNPTAKGDSSAQETSHGE
jgi:tetratricopeptide (TPR) repeat protein